MAIAQFIDHTLLKPTATVPEIKTLCQEAVQYGFAAVCVPPYYVTTAREFLKEEKTAVATVAGFPFGYSAIEAKLAEVQKAIKDGADELDLVMNVAALKNKDMDFLKAEISALSSLTRQHQKTLKVIIESGVLTHEEIIQCCNLYKAYPVQFLKTSTGYAEKGATLEAVQLMRQHLPSSIQIKASGGIKSYAFAVQLVQAGATRLGCSASVAIVKDEPAIESGY